MCSSTVWGGIARVTVGQRIAVAIPAIKARQQKAHLLCSSTAVPQRGWLIQSIAALHVRGEAEMCSVGGNQDVLIASTRLV
jgi:hypothetical protein